MNSRSIRIASALMFLHVFLSVRSVNAAAADAEVDQVKAAVLARWKALQCIDAAYTISHNYTPPKPPGAQQPATRQLSTETPNFHDLEGIRAAEERLRYFNGRVRWDNKPSDEALQASLRQGYQSAAETIRVIADGRAESLTRRQNVVLGSINFPEANLPLRDGIEAVLGLRAGDDGPWTSEEFLRSLHVVRGRDNTFLLQWTDAMGRSMEWTIDAARGYAVVLYRRLYYPEGVKPCVEISASDFELVDGVPLPGRVVGRGLAEDGRANYSWTVTDIRYSLREQTPEEYLIAYPKGAQVLDRRTGTHYRTEYDGEVFSDEAVALHLAQHQNFGGGADGSAKMPSTPQAAAKVVSNEPTPRSPFSKGGRFAVGGLSALIALALIGWKARTRT